jgi:Phage integrase family
MTAIASSTMPRRLPPGCVEDRDRHGNVRIYYRAKGRLKCGELAFLVNDLGRPFTDAGFGNKFREWCNQAGLHHCTAHGLRKAGATIAANNGATAHQLMAIFGWDTLKMAEAYTRAADQERLAEAAMHMLETPEQNRTKSSPTKDAGGTFLEKNPDKSNTNFLDGARGGNRTPTPCGTRF